jgi:hypothetical protein
MIALLGAMSLLPIGGMGQEPRRGPLELPPKREVKRIPVEPNPEPPPVPVEQMIRSFVEKEDEFQQARNTYTYRQTIRVQEFEEEGRPAGEFLLTSDILFTPEGKPAAAGKRYEKIVREPPSTLRRTTVSQDDLADWARIPAFPLTTARISKYNLTYLGKQPVDELTTYVFRVQPKELERGQQYFEGVIWVDDRDLVIVKTYGKFVGGRAENQPASAGLFDLFETYREQVDAKYWFPAYTRADQTVKLKNREVPIRLTIRYTDYKPR